MRLFRTPRAIAMGYDRELTLYDIMRAFILPHVAAVWLVVVHSIIAV